MAGWDIGSFGFAPKSWNKAGNEFFFGSDSSMDPFDRDSLSWLKKMVQNGGGLEENAGYQGGNNFLQKLFSNDPEMMKQFEQPYINNFNENIAPGIAERFAGMGTGGGASSSSGLQNSLAQAGRGLQSDLAAMRGQMQLQGLPQALQYAQQPIANKYNAAQAIPNQYYETPGQSGFVQSFANSFAQGLGRGFGG